MARPAKFLLFLFLLRLIFDTAAVRAVDVNFTMQSANTVPQGLRFMALYPIGGPYTNGAGATITRDRMTGSTDATGQLIISNLYGLSYRGEFQGTSGWSTNFYNFPVTNGYVYAATYAGAPTNAGGIIAYSQAQTYALFLARTNPVAYTNIANTFYGNIAFNAGSQWGGNSIDGAGFHGDPLAGTFSIANMFTADYLGRLFASTSVSAGSNGYAPSGIALNSEGPARVNNTLSVSNAIVVQGNIQGMQNLSWGGVGSGNGSGITNVPATSITGNITNFAGNGSGITNLSGSAANLTNILRTYITPFDCGAIGDAVTDDYNALQKMFFIACSSNWIAFIPPAPGGAYACSQTLLITNGMNHVNIQGAGGAMFISDGSTLSKACIKITAAVDGLRITNVQSNVRIEGIRLTNSFGPSLTTHGIWFDGNGADNDCSSIKNCSAQGFGKGLTLSSVADSIVESCEFATNAVGIEISGGTYANPPIINQVRIIANQISYNYVNQLHITNAGQYVLVQSCDISPQSGASDAAVRIERNAFVTLSDMHIEPYSGKPCIVLTDNGAGVGGTILNLNNIATSLDGTPGANTYSVVATNATMTLVNATFSDVADGSLPMLITGDFSGIRSDRAFKARFIVGGNILTNTIPGSMIHANNSGTLANNAGENLLTMLYNDFDAGSGAYINSYLMIGARLFDSCNNVGIQPVDVFQYFKDTAVNGAGIPSTNGFALNFTAGAKFMVGASGIVTNMGTLVRSNTLSSIPTLQKGDTYYWSSNGVAYVICCSPSAVLTTNKLGP